MSCLSMVVSDLDGTILQDGRRISTFDLDTLREIGEKGIIRVIATGRSLYSARAVLQDDFPVDYLIFSSGAGIVGWREKRLLMKQSLTPDEVKTIVKLLLVLKCDFMVHDPVPYNHFFTYYTSHRDNPDFERRRILYSEFATELDIASYRYREACQIIAIEPNAYGGSMATRVRQLLPGLKVIRTTSPLDRQSVWIEIFPSGVSKASASDWICRKHGINGKRVLGIGNDYNDLDLLSWAHTGILVGDAPEELKSMFVAVGEKNGFSEAVSLWLRQRNAGR